MLSDNEAGAGMRRDRYMITENDERRPLGQCHKKEEMQINKVNRVYHL